MARSRSCGVSACDSKASSSDTPSSLSMRVASSTRAQAVETVVALERVVDAEALREIVPGVQLVSEVAHQLQQRGRQIAIGGHS